MFKVKIISVGKNQSGFVADAVAEFEKRLSSQVNLELVYVKESSQQEVERAKLEEGDRLVAATPGDYTKIVLDEHGKLSTSIEFAQKLEHWRDFDGGKIAFLIGGAYGHSEDVLASADFTLALSKMTFTHQMVRVFLLEQVYRGLQILQGSPYHKE